MKSSGLNIPHWPLRGWLLWPGLLALWLYALLDIALPSIGSAAANLVAVLGLIAVLIHGGSLRSSGPLWLLLSALLVESISWGMGYWHHPQWVADNPELDRLAKLFIFISVAWWLGGSTRHTLLVWLLALVGLLITPFSLGNGIQEWVDGFQGQRVGFGVRNLQHGSMLFGVAFLGLVCFAKRIVCRAGRLSSWRFVIWLSVLIVCAVSLVIGQTRAVWLALLCALPVAGALWFFINVSRGRFRYVGGKRLALVGVAAVLVVTTLILTFQDTLMKRVYTESGVVTELMSGDIDNVPYSSIGIRIHSWRAAFEWIAERPVFGWGSKGRSLVMEQTPWLPQDIKDQFGHLHNFMIEIWVAYGLLGVLLILTLMFWVGRGSWLAWRGGVMPSDIALFGTAFFIYWVVVNQFESYNSFWTGVYVHNLIVGGLVTHIWRWQVETGGSVLGRCRTHPPIREPHEARDDG
ncbi:O-antigen ligase family protein [Halomonas sp. PBN3]|uniref:O-antigen ligase family protein n=1 Tax=Halomonas sp. PBN3 TaxID=1397528 RepID=UPI0009DDB28F|nr:O-antigen ligase family protein [Halomonas sp. PBN3]